MKRRGVELLLDTCLLVLLLILFAPRLTGLGLHEWIGLVLVPPTVVHILLSWRWIAASTRRLSRPNSARVRVNYLLNALLFVLLTLVVGSGVAISEVVVPRLGIPTIDDRSWRALHNQSLNWLLLTAGFHIAMNWAWVRRAFTSLRARGARSAAAVRLAPFTWVSPRVLAILAAAAVVIGAAVAWLGVPSENRRYALTEIARFASSWHGWFQLAGEALLLFGAIYLGRKGLRLRL